MLEIDGYGIFCDIFLRWMSLNLMDKSALVQVMAWCCQAPSHCPSQWWPRSMSLKYGVTGPQWVKVYHFFRITILDIMLGTNRNSCGLLKTYGDKDLGQHWLRWLMACCLMAPSHYLNQCCLIINGVVWYVPYVTSQEELENSIIFHRKC